MKTDHVVLLAVVGVQFVGAVPAAQPPPQAPDHNAYYQIGPDSLPHEGVPSAVERSFNGFRKK